MPQEVMRALELSTQNVENSKDGPWPSHASKGAPEVSVTQSAMSRAAHAWLACPCLLTCLCQAQKHSD